MCGSVSENSRPRLAVLVELERALEQVAGQLLVVGDLGAAAACRRTSSSIGLGSSRSTWLGPPCMKSWMTALAFAGACGGRGRTSNRAGTARGSPPGLAQQRGQGQAAEAAAEAGQDLAARRALATDDGESSGDSASVRLPVCGSIDVRELVALSSIWQRSASARRAALGRRRAGLLGRGSRGSSAALAVGRRPAEGEPHGVARRVAGRLAQRPGRRRPRPAGSGSRC